MRPSTRLHWVRDVTYDEDHPQVRADIQRIPRHGLSCWEVGFDYFQTIRDRVNVMVLCPVRIWSSDSIHRTLASMERELSTPEFNQICSGLHSTATAGQGGFWHCPVGIHRL